MYHYILRTSFVLLSDNTRAVLGVHLRFLTEVVQNKQKIRGGVQQRGDSSQAPEKRRVFCDQIDTLAYFESDFVFSLDSQYQTVVICKKPGQPAASAFSC